MMASVEKYKSVAVYLIIAAILVLYLNVQGKNSPKVFNAPENCYTLATAEQFVAFVPLRITDYKESIENRLNKICPKAYMSGSTLFQCVGLIPLCLMALAKFLTRRERVKNIFTCVFQRWRYIVEYIYYKSFTRAFLF